MGLGVTTHRVAAQFPDVVAVLPAVTIAPLLLWITAHRELRDSPRLKLVFDTLSQALAVQWRPAGAAAPPDSDSAGAPR